MLIFFVAGYTFTIISCNQETKKLQENPAFITAKGFLSHLSRVKLDSALAGMDSYLIERADMGKLSESIQELSNKIVSDYAEGPEISFVSSEKTFHDEFPTIFLICKIESMQRFGYYFFYINEQTNKILLVSEFARTKDKR